MSELTVWSLSIEETLRRLKDKEWLIPEFQRDFVWSVGDVIDLIHSILNARPIGMVTIWEQPDDNGLALGPLSLPDVNPDGNMEIDQSFATTTAVPRKSYAVLDGRQRSTAIAMAFGGFRTQHPSFKTSGRYFLNVSALDPLEQIAFMKEDEVLQRHFDCDGTCISQGYFPLSSTRQDETIMAQWLRYVQAIRDPANYSDAAMPDQTELSRRNLILMRAFEGINRTKLAAYVVPDFYRLADICDIFEKLNTTGTKVSTVDLIHSWLYAETHTDPGGPVRLREWIDELGQKDGAIGWAKSDDRPELPVQIVTACYIALEEKATPRRIGKAPVVPLTSIKAGDLLGTPVEHWKMVMQKDLQLAEYLGDFQRVVAGGLFPWKWSPYPVTSAIYVSLRFHASVDRPETHPWGRDDLDVLFRAFFWRNALTNRYDQGFLTQLGVDVKELKRILQARPQFRTACDWSAWADTELTKLIARPIPGRDYLYSLVSDGRRGGALQKALCLPMQATANADLVDSRITIRYLESSSALELHHIYPREWCRSNRTGAYASLLDKRLAGKDWVESVSNLVPLSRRSNNLWKAKNPGQMLNERNVEFAQAADTLRSAFIDEECFQYLLRGAEGMAEFWHRRAGLVADDLVRRMRVNL